MQGATVEVARARCPSFSSKLCSQFGPFQHGSSHERRLCKNRSHQLAGSKMVLSRDPTRIISFGQLVSSCHRLQHLRLLLNRDCTGKKVKLRSCRYPPVFARRSRFVLGKLCYIVKGHSKIGWGIDFGWALVGFAVMATPRPSQHARSVLEVTSHSEAVTVRP